MSTSPVTAGSAVRSSGAVGPVNPVNPVGSAGAAGPVSTVGVRTAAPREEDPRGTTPVARPRRAARTPVTPGLVAGLLGLGAGTVGLRVGDLHGVPLFALLVAAALAVAVVGTLRARRPWRTLRPTAVDAVFVLYLVVRVGAELLDSGPGAARLGTVADLAVGYAAVWAARLAVARRSDLPRFLLVLVLTSVPVSLLAVLQIADVPGVGRLLLETTDSSGLARRVAEGRDIRATSTIGHWTNLGGYLCGIVALGCLALVQAPSWRREPLLVAVVGLAVLAQLATLTFAPLLVTLAVLALTVVRLRVVALALGASAVVVLAGAVVLGGLVERRVRAQVARNASTTGATGLLPETVAYRIRIWRHETLPAVGERPWTGWGNGLYLPGSTSPRPPYLRWISPESEWLRVAVQAGIPAALVLLALLLLVLQRFRRAARADRGWTVLSWYLVGLMVVSCLHSHLSDRGAPLVLWVATGAALGVTTRGTTGTRVRTPARAPARAAPDGPDGGPAPRKVVRT